MLQSPGGCVFRIDSDTPGRPVVLSAAMRLLGGGVRGLGIEARKVSSRDTLLAMRMKDDDWSAVIDTNLSAVFRLSRGVLRGMIKARGGRIVNSPAGVGSAGNAGQADEAARKAGGAGRTARRRQRGRKPFGGAPRRRLVSRVAAEAVKVRWYS